MHRIVLIGYMGAGKTTVGRMLAKDMGLMFYDLDWYITSRMRRTVAQIFETMPMGMNIAIDCWYLRD